MVADGTDSWVTRVAEPTLLLPQATLTSLQREQVTKMESHAHGLGSHVRLD
jgi:hypothetical protein